MDLLEKWADVPVSEAGARERVELVCVGCLGSPREVPFEVDLEVFSWRDDPAPAFAGELLDESGRLVFVASDDERPAYRVDRGDKTPKSYVFG